MSKKREYSILNIVTWLTGILVSLSVGFSMTGASKVTGALTLPWWAGGSLLTIIVGWVVVITTVISVVLAILER
jgi:hypothetical protein|tara:strand:- start:7488 stop:7709 length:222 start_codon:yes stop_codon:yes gene_type:complete